jgi:hypothetical protein
VSGTFNIVRVAVAPLKGRSAVAQAKLAEIVKEAKRTGVVQKAIGRAGLRGAHVAPELILPVPQYSVRFCAHAEVARLRRYVCFWQILLQKSADRFAAQCSFCRAQRFESSLPREHRRRIDVARFVA